MVFGILGEQIHDLSATERLDIRSLLFEDKDITLGALTETVPYHFSGPTQDGISIIFFGSIYDAEGENIQSHLPFETIRNLYKKYGQDFVRAMEGDFLTIIWDEEKLLIIKNGFEITPLYYVIDKNTFYFSSRIAFFLKLGLDLKIDKREVKNLFKFHYNLQEKTLFSDCFQLPTYHSLIVSLNRDTKRIFVRKIFTGPPQFKEKGDAAEASVLSKLDSILKSVMHKAEFDGEIGLTLSGGIDSTALLLMLSRAANRPIHTFTLSCDLAHPDIHYSKLASNAFKTRHHEIIVDLPTYVKKLPQMIYMIEKPIKAGLSIFLLEELEQNVDVVIYGEGGDELFNVDYFYSRLPLELTKDFSVKGEKEGRLIFNIQAGPVVNYIHSHVKSLENIRALFPYLSAKLVYFSQYIPRHLLRDKCILKRIILNSNKSELKPILSREKRSFNSNFDVLFKELDNLSYDVIKDKYFKQHPYREYFSQRSDMLLFDLFDFIFRKQKANISKNFSIFNLY